MGIHRSADAGDQTQVRRPHLLHIYAKLGVNDRAAAVGAAFERGLLTPGGGR
jgi:hypothetical protein